MAEESPPRNQQKPPQLLTVSEMTLQYGLDRVTVYRRIKSGQLEAVKKPGASGKNARYFIKDPGWQNVGLHDTTKHGSEFAVDDVHVLTGMEVSLLLNVTPRSVRKMAEDGRLKFIRTGIYGRSHRRYCIADVRRMLATKNKGSFQIKRPSRKAVRDAVLKWARDRLNLP